MLIGNYNTLEIKKIVDFGVYLSDGETTILMPKKYLVNEPKLDEKIDCFVYLDSEDRLIATTEKPLGVVDELVYLECVDTTTLGAFLNWGLPKDLFVPFKHQGMRMIKGKKYLVKILFDETSKRLLGSNNFGRILHGDVKTLTEKQPIEIIPYSETTIGYKVVADGKYVGMIYKNQIFENIEFGQKYTGYISKIRDDNRVDVTLNKSIFEKSKDEKEQFLTLLKQSGGFLPVTSKTSPDEIMRRFQMSKKNFKIIIGMLYKARKIEIKDNGIYLV